MNLKIVYFDFPFWRAEVARISLFKGNISFDDIRVNGDDGTPWAFNLIGNQEIIGNEQTDHALYVEGGGTVDSVYIDGDLYVTGAVDCGNKGRLASRFAAADASPKPFDLKHPSKEGWRLRYACIEGPEAGVYYRGRLKESNVINLPTFL